MFNILWDLLQESSLSSHSKALGSQQGKINQQQTALTSHSQKLDRQHARLNLMEARLIDLEMKVTRFHKLTEMLMEFIGERLDLDEDDVALFMEEVTSLFEPDEDISNDFVECLYCNKQTLRFLADCIHCHEKNIRYKHPDDVFMKK